eukprot:8923588-Ditylum_brightwellii.AAC.1
MPYMTLTKVNDNPNYVELGKLRHEVYRNCAAMHSVLNGNMGHLRLVMLSADYTARNGGIAYVASPNNLGPYDGTIANNTGSFQRS